VTTALLLVPALLLDAVLGEPAWLWSRLPHPAVLMGRAVRWLDLRLNRGGARRARGVATVIVLVMGALATGFAIRALGWPFEVAAAAILLAQRSLVDHVAAVAQGLRTGIGDARIMVARIVSRDTAAMDGPAVARSAIESASENLSDGVIAPAFWFLVAGLPGILVYKAVNTADSMIGYRTERYEQFGWAAARLDDVLNLVPARATALLIALTHGVTDARGIVGDARRHRSPNAGWPEAAMARALGVALAGPRSYDGQMRDFPFVHPAGRRDIGAPEIDAACRALWRSWGAALGLVALLAII
jgi:adenosylcobinamide-phosphate synthase